MIKFMIVPNKLSANPTGYVARVHSRGIVGLEEIAEDIARLGTTVSKADVLNVIEHYNEVVALRLTRGETVLTPAARYRVSIRGVFDHEADFFDPERHTLTVRLTPGPLLEKAMREAQVDRLYLDPAAPGPKTFVDTFTEEINKVATPGREGWLIGTRLHFDPTDPAQGVFFLDQAGGETRVESVGWNKDRRLFFIIPALAAGDYDLEVRAAIGVNGVRTGRLGVMLRVAG